jgi:hypothetical protein
MQLLCCRVCCFPGVQLPWRPPLLSMCAPASWGPQHHPPCLCQCVGPVGQQARPTQVLHHNVGGGVGGGEHSGGGGSSSQVGHRVGAAEVTSRAWFCPLSVAAWSPTATSTFGGVLLVGVHYRLLPATPLSNPLLLPPLPPHLLCGSQLRCQPPQL